jgi:hypothetical protein
LHPLKKEIIRMVMNIKQEFGDLEKLKNILIEISGEAVVGQLTDENIAEFNEILIACAEILNNPSVPSE